VGLLGLRRTVLRCWRDTPVDLLFPGYCCISCPDAPSGFCRIGWHIVVADAGRCEGCRW
jgi:hypothetical protein